MLALVLATISRASCIASGLSVAATIGSRVYHSFSVGEKNQPACLTLSLVSCDHLNRASQRSPSLVILIGLIWIMILSCYAVDEPGRSARPLSLGRSFV